MQDTNIFPLPKHQPDGWVKRSLGQKNGFISGAPAGWDFFSSPTGRKAQYSFFFNLFRLTKMLFSSSVIFAHLLPLITNFSLTQVIFAFTRTLDVRFEFVIRKNDIFWGSVGIEHHFLNQKKYFCAHPVEFFFFTRCAGNKPIFSFGLTRPRKSVPPPFQIVHNKHRMKIPWEGAGASIRLILVQNFQVQTSKPITIVSNTHFRELQVYLRCAFHSYGGVWSPPFSETPLFHPFLF